MQLELAFVYLAIERNEGIIPFPRAEQCCPAATCYAMARVRRYLGLPEIAFLPT
jgi:hypothetical protein